MADNIARAPEAWRNFSDKVPLRAMVLDKGDLKKLYRIINDKQSEFRDRFMPILAIQPNETQDDFNARKKRVFEAFVTSMTIQRTNGEYLHGNNEQFLDEDNLPDQIQSILFTTSSVPRTLGIEPVSRIVLFLDFTRPPLFNLSRLPSQPTANESNFEVASDSESLFAASRARLVDFFNERKARVNWLHGGAVYDFSVFVAGIPIGILAVYCASEVVNRFTSLSNIVAAAIYIYVFFLALNVFRILFMYSRWVFPKIELKSERSSPFRHRVVWAGITIAVVGALLASAIWDSVTK
ncbi:MAG: hypothetical protein WAU78_05860 [Roseiarcus sp.]